MLFLTAGYPKLDSTVPLVLKLAQAGADIIELGMPFSDPLADGPVIQASSQQAIKNGITLDRIFNQVKEIRKHTNIPLVLMGYLNPILHYGEETILCRCSEEWVLTASFFRKFHWRNRIVSCPSIENTILLIFFLSVQLHPMNEFETSIKLSSGFLYCVSTTGVTGRSNIGDIDSYVKRVKHNATNNPVLVGFGIKTPADAQRISRSADGVIVGSALIQRIAQRESLKGISNWVMQLKNSLTT